MTDFSRRSLLGMGAAGILAGRAAFAQDSDDRYYAGKTITLTIAAAAGGLADTVARIFAPVFQNHIPGNPTIIVANKPGAGGMMAASQLMRAGSADGTEITILLGNDLTTPLIRSQTNQFDPAKVRWIGAIDSGDYPYAMYVYKTAPAQSAREMLRAKPQLQVGTTGFYNENHIYPAMLNRFLGTNLHLVSGYKGAGEVYLALERGEVNCWFESARASLNHAGKLGQLAASGAIKPILLMGDKRIKEFPGVPAVTEFLTTDRQKTVAKFLFISARSGRPLAVPKGVPAPVVAVLRKAFDATMSDPEFKELMQKRLAVQVSGVTGSEMDQTLAQIGGITPALLKEVRELVLSH